MKKFVLLVIISVLPMLAMAQVPGGQVTRPVKKQQTTETTTNKKKEDKKNKDNAPKRERTNNRAVTSKREDQPKPRQEVEAAGYDVTFTCNVPSATMLIDGMANGTASGSRFLKTGSHTVKLVAEGYE